MNKNCPFPSCALNQSNQECPSHYQEMCNYFAMVNEDLRRAEEQKQSQQDHRKEPELG